jgi:predicted nucleic acid-binding protein
VNGLGDTSAWTTRHRSPAAAAAFDAAAAAHEIALCEVVVFELLRTARDTQNLAALRLELESLPQVHVDRGTWQRAMDVYELLARRGPLHHRQVPWSDVVIAAAGERAGLPIIHYDRHFETVAEVTGQPVEAIAPLGSL